MAQQTIAMEYLKQLLQLESDGVPIREMERRTGISRNTIKKYLRKLSDSAVSGDTSNAQLATLAYNNDSLAHDELRQRQLFEHFPYAEKELSKTGVHRKLLLQEYMAQHPDEVAYNPGKVDQFFHRYQYDAENRLIEVETSPDYWVWSRDARYQYYKHGPLARTELGDNLVQGIDYAYTLQGWLKGVNGNSLYNGQFDIGQDGAATGRNKYVARDAYAFSLLYYTGDYNPIGADHYFPGYSAYLNSDYRPLYNGNISSMAVNIGKLNSPVVYNYKYDQLNRITAMDRFTGLNQTTNSWSAMTVMQGYRERIAYDPNGNILRYQRYGTDDKLAMDSLTYQYNRDANGRLLNNQLVRVRDNVSSAEYIEDIDDQPVNNYSYDAIGNLVRDSAEGISQISWTVYGKIRQISKRDGTVIQYRYDASGNRIGKSVAKPSGTTAYTWYVRDASGNVMSTYETSGTGESLPSTLFQREVHLYGSSRIGIFNRRVDVKQGYAAPTVFSSYRGQKFFELSNHLGNVLATISDRKIGYSSGGIHIDYYEADVVTASDYYPFGMLMPGRQFGQGLTIAGGEFSETTEANGYELPVDLILNSRSGTEPVEYVASGTIELVGEFESGTSDEFEAYIADESYAGTGNIGGTGASGTAGLYRYGFNGKENDNEVKGAGNQQDYGMRIYDPRLGRFLSVDPLTKGYPMLTPYQFASNTPIAAIDIDGKEAGIPLNGVGWSGTKMSNYFDNEKGRELWSNTMGTGLLVGGAVVADVFITRGWITRTLLASQILGAFEHNNAKTPEGRTAQDQRAKEALTDAFITYGAGKILGISLNVGVSALKGLAQSRFNFAKDFYKKAGYAEQRTLDHTRGIDLSQKVYEETYKKGTVLEQWTYIDKTTGKPIMGDYYALPGADPNKLGIPLADRIKTKVVLTEDTKFLRSTSGDIENWNKPGEILKGGETQLFQTNVKYEIKK